MRLYNAHYKKIRIFEFRCEIPYLNITQYKMPKFEGMVMLVIRITLKLQNVMGRNFE